MKDLKVDENSIFQVSRDLSLILLLASGRRIHDLTLLRTDKDSMIVGDTYVIFWPDLGSKTDNSASRQSGWKLSGISDQNLNPVKWVKIYISLTEKRRNAGGHRLNSLFITSRGRVAPASTSIIAGWLRTAFSELNINFSPGSIRSAVASSRRDSNIPMDTILKNGNWRSDRNVIKHYFKEIIRSHPNDDYSECYFFLFVNMFDYKW